MNKFFIITNKSKDKDESITNKVINYIESSGRIVTGKSVSFPDEDIDIYANIEKEISNDTQCIIVLGGDGTLLRAARHLYMLEIPFVGINLGHLGYLTDGSADNFKNILSKVFDDDFVIEDRMLINCDFSECKNANCNKQVSLNDITLTRNSSLKIIDFNLYVNGALLYTYKADGIVISTPTGSTAYSLSLGGPIATPTSKLMVVTPIAPHSLNNRSLVLSADDVLEIEVVPGENDKTIEYLVFSDGDSCIKMNPGDKIKISKEEKIVRLIRHSRESFLKTLKEKMQ